MLHSRRFGRNFEVQGEARRLSVDDLFDEFDPERDVKKQAQARSLVTPTDPAFQQGWRDFGDLEGDDR